MEIVLLGLVALGLVGLFAVHDPESTAPAGPRPEANVMWTALAAGAVCGSFAAATALVARTAAEQQPLPEWLRALPLIVIDDRAPLFGHAPHGVLALCCAVAETASLALLYLALRGRRAGGVSRAILASSFVCMSALALHAQALTSFDIYAYAGAAHGGFSQGYHPIATPFAGDWNAINRIYGSPIVPSPYGPVWLAIAVAVTHGAPSLAAALLNLRVLELGALCACICALLALRQRVEVLALFALNPALFTQYVVDGHNDLCAVAFVLAAMAVRPRSRIAAVGLAACAAAMKLPFLLIAPLAFAGAASRRERIAGGLATLTLGGFVSASTGGSAYLHAMQLTAMTYRATFTDPAINGIRAALCIVAFATVAIALTTRRFSPTGAWTLVAFGSSLFGWYWAWGIPLASLERRRLPVFLVSLPVVTALVATAYAPSLARWDVLIITSVLAAPAAWLLLRMKPERVHLVAVSGN